MNTLQLKLKENKDEELTSLPDVDIPEQFNFIDSKELNELRDIILDVPEDIELLLLNDDVIVLGVVNSDNTYLYSLPEEAEDFVLIELPLHLDEIKQNASIIKYTPEAIDSRHEKVVDLLMHKLEPTKKEEVESNEK